MPESRIGEQVREFHLAFGLPVRSAPDVGVGLDQTALRLALIEEEVGELRTAALAGDLIGIADALADIVYVAYGSAHVYGIDLDAVLDEVHDSNMTKLGPDGRPLHRADGKVIKGPDYRPPDVARRPGRSVEQFDHRRADSAFLIGVGRKLEIPAGNSIDRWQRGVRARLPRIPCPPGGLMSTSVGRWFRKITTDDEVMEADQLSSESTASGCQRASECWQGQSVAVLGRLRSVDLRPTDALATLNAELWDGTDAIQLVWFGRRSIPGVETGRIVKVSGRLALKDGRKTIYNPVYQLMPAHS